MAGEADLAQGLDRVGLQDLGRPAVVVELHQHRDQPFHDEGVAVGPEMQVRLAVDPVHVVGEPDLRHAAFDLGLFGLLRLGHRLELLAEVDDIGVAVLPIVEEGEIVDQLVHRHRHR
jgi:hypothetical protein